MADTPIDSSHCPSAEDLCAWFDGEQVDTTVSAHVDGCPQCKSIVQSYKRIDNRIQENLERPTQQDMGILVRIKDSSMKEVKRSHSPILDTAVKLKIVGFIAAIACLLGVIYVAQKKQRTPVPTPDQPINRVDADPTITTSSPLDKQISELVNANKDALAGIILIAVGTNPELMDVLDADNPAEPPKVIKSFVSKHPAAPLKLLKPLLDIKSREYLDETIFRTADYATVIIQVQSRDQSLALDNAFKELGATHTTKGETTSPSGVHTIRYSFLLDEK